MRPALILTLIPFLLLWCGAARAAEAVDTGFRECADCPEMVAVPAGRFTMGSQTGEAGRFDTEAPRHVVTVKAFAIGRYTVTNGEFLAFLRQTGYRPAECNPLTHLGWQVPEKGRAVAPGGPTDPERQPAVCLSWDDAQAYVAWLNSMVRAKAPRTGGPYRLPSEAEWEYAARAGTETARWWGDDIGAGQANCHGCGSRYDNRLIAEVGTFGPNPFGLYDMLGNVWQWVADCWNETYVGAPADGRAWTTGDCGRRVMRGGSWSNLPALVRSAARSKGDRTGADFDYSSYAGFRVARDLP